MVISEYSWNACSIPFCTVPQYSPCIAVGMAMTILYVFFSDTADVWILYLYPVSCRAFSTASLLAAETLPLLCNILSTVPEDTPAILAMSFILTCLAICGFSLYGLSACAVFPLCTTLDFQVRVICRMSVRFH